MLATDVVMLTEGCRLSYVYTAVAAGDATPRESQVMAINVVVAAGMSKLNAWDVSAVPVAHVGAAPLIV
jgi:alkylhydroperoxidase/carboxymuconolactone decarboxylase family protein YurZ